MDKIKIIMDNTPDFLQKICLDVTGEFLPSKTTIKRSNSDIIITVDNESYTDKIYGREIGNKLYFARHEFISKELPDIDYYMEFFSDGIEIKF